MCKIKLLFLIFYICFCHSDQWQIAEVDTSEQDNHYDLLIFSQQWPVTMCKEWVHFTPEGHCVLPNKNNRWTIHGIWPTIPGQKSPSFCNMSWAFDPEQIKSLKSDLDQAWTNIFKETETYSFWEHEWLKHGTCATDLQPLDSQFKYFSKALKWNEEYSLSDMLESANIFPSDTKELTPEELINAVKDKIKKNPMVGCNILDDVQYLEELRICFDKQFNLIDCNPVVYDNCDISKGIIFPANV